MKQTLIDFNLKLNYISIYFNNTSAINLTKNPILHSRTNHIEIKYYFIHNHIKKSNITLEFVIIKKQFMNTSTKSLSEDQLCAFRLELGMGYPF